MIDLPPDPTPKQEQVIEQRLLDCGLEPGGISVQYEDYLQGIEIVIAPSAGATSDQFACINDAAGYELVRFEDGAMFAAYTEFKSELARPEMLAMFEDRLKAAGLWEGFPDRNKFGSLEDYAKALEAHAGIEPGSALRVSGDGILFDPPNVSQDYTEFAEKYSNLLSAVGYASVRDRVNFGFIGNEKVAE